MDSFTTQIGATKVTNKDFDHIKDILKFKNDQYLFSTLKGKWFIKVSDEKLYYCNNPIQIIKLKQQEVL